MPASNPNVPIALALSATLSLAVAAAACGGESGASDGALDGAEVSEEDARPAGSSARADSAPRLVAPGGAVAGEWERGEGAPNGAEPGAPALTERAPTDPAPEDAVPLDAAPQDAAPAGATPLDAASQTPAPGDPTPGAPAPTDSASPDPVTDESNPDPPTQRQEPPLPLQRTDPEPAPVPRTYEMRGDTREPVTVPAGTSVELALDRDLSTGADTAGGVFTATVTEDVLGYRGEVLLPMGAIAHGRVLESRESAGSDAPATLTLSIEGVSVDGRRHPLRATVVEVESEAEARDGGATSAAKVGVGAAAGAVLGRILGGDTRDALRGAAAGAAAGAAVALTTRSGHASVAEGARLVIRLDEPLVLEERRQER